MTKLMKCKREQIHMKKCDTNWIRSTNQENKYLLTGVTPLKGERKRGLYTAVQMILNNSWV